MKSTGMKGDLYRAQKERLLHVMLGHVALSHYLSSCLLAGTICDVEGCYFGLSNVSNTKRDSFLFCFFLSCFWTHKYKIKVSAGRAGSF